MTANKKILVTGAAGFIGYHLCEHLLAQGHEVIGLDNINDYYDVNLKYGRLTQLGITQNQLKEDILVQSTTKPAFTFIKTALENAAILNDLFANEKFDAVCNLAAQAGVRYSLENPKAYIDSNIVGFMNILEACRHHNVKKLVYASSSSVYGTNDKLPFSTEDTVDHPISIYAATKKSNELMAHTYSHLFGIETIGLRFFTVYGPWGRPDMALFLFTEAILKGKPIQVFNNGNLSRDFTYVADIVEGVYNTLLMGSKNKNKYKIYNIGNSSPVSLQQFIEAIELETGRKAIQEMRPMQAGDVEKTWADVSGLQQDFGYQPNTDLQEGVHKFVNWYKEYYRR